jgi:CubicO group peptidase (beta-lactamase class C family)
VSRTDQLPRATPESQGVSSSAVLRLIDALDALEHVHSAMVLRHGHVIAEGWWAPYRADRPHALFSISKSFTSTAIGLLIDDGRLSLDDPVVDLLPDDAPVPIDERLGRLRVRHLLSMSTGHAMDGLETVTAGGDWARHLLAVPLTSEPGTRFLYETGATYLLAVIATRLTGHRLLELITPRLLSPLGIAGATWERSPDGIDVGGFGLSMRTQDIAAFGQLLLDEGSWHGRQLVPAAWIATATSAHVSNGDPAAASDWTQGYGFQFWRGRHGSVRADGAFGQLCVMLPEQQVVVAVTAGLPDMQQELDVLWDTLLPALDGVAPSPPDAAAHARLTSRLAGLRLPTPHGVATSPRADGVSGVRYRMSGDPGIDEVTLSVTGDDLDLDLRGPVLSTRVRSTHGRWLEGGTAVPDGVGVITDRAPGVLAAAHAWLTDDLLEIRAWAIDSAFCWTIRMTFHDAGSVGFELAQNLAFGPPPVLRATGIRDVTDLATG